VAVQDAEVAESVLSKQINDLEPTLTRHGYGVKDLAEQFNANFGDPLVVRELDPVRTRITQPDAQSGSPLDAPSVWVVAAFQLHLM